MDEKDYWSVMEYNHDALTWDLPPIKVIILHANKYDVKDYLVQRANAIFGHDFYFDNSDILDGFEDESYVVETSDSGEPVILQATKYKNIELIEK